MRRMGIGQRIRAKRLQRGYKNAAAFARMVKISQASLWNLESGKTKVPKGSTLLRIADGLHVNQIWLMTAQGPEDPVESLTPQAIAFANCFMSLSFDDRERVEQIILHLQQASELIAGRRVTRGTAEDVERLRKRGANQADIPGGKPPKPKTRPPKKA